MAWILIEWWAWEASSAHTVVDSEGNTLVFNTKEQAEQYGEANLQKEWWTAVEIV